MTRTEFDHLLSRIKALPPEQLLPAPPATRPQLAQPKKPALPGIAQSRQARHTAARESRSRGGIPAAPAEQRPDHLACPTPPWTSTTTTPTISRSPSRASRCRKPSSASGAEVATAYFLRFQRPGQALRPGGRHSLGASPHPPRLRPCHLRGAHHRCRSDRRRRPPPQGPATHRRQVVVDPPSLLAAPCRALHRHRHHARPARRRHAAGQHPRAACQRRRAVGRRPRTPRLRQRQNSPGVRSWNSSLK